MGNCHQLGDCGVEPQLVAFSLYQSWGPIGVAFDFANFASVAMRTPNVDVLDCLGNVLNVVARLFGLWISAHIR